MKDKLTVVTACYHDSKEHIFQLEESCGFYNLPLSVYGLNEWWTGDWRKHKMEGFLNHIRGLDTEYILFSDGWDSFALATEDKIIRKYKSFSSDIVIAGNLSCYPNTSLGQHFKKGGGPFTYICAGQFMGTKEALVSAMVQVLNRYGGKDDQEAWSLAFLNNWADIKIDTKAKLFLTTTCVDEESIQEYGGGVRFKPTRTLPTFIHFAGGKGGSPNELLMKKTYNYWLTHRK